MPIKRINYIDWVRILALGVLIIFHCSRFFDFIGFHLKNDAQSELVTQFFLFATSWLMPLFFLVSGSATFFALQSKKEGFVGTRINRLAIPFLFGILILIPPQKYLEQAARAGSFKSITGFISDYPSMIFNTGIGFSLGWFGHIGHHLWYLAYLFVQTILLLPLLKWICQKDYELSAMSRSYLVVALILPLLAVNIILRPYFHQYLHWADFAHFTYFFILGFAIAKFGEDLIGLLDNLLVPMCLLAILTSISTHYIALSSEYMAKWFDKPDYSWDYIGFVILRSLNSLSWVLLLLVLAYRHLRKGPRFLSRLNESVLPIYMLHQTIIIAIGYFVIQWSLGIGAKFVIILIAGCLAMIVAYLLIKRFNSLRYLFGMKLLT